MLKGYPVRGANKLDYRISMPFRPQRLLPIYGDSAAINLERASTEYILRKKTFTLEGIFKPARLSALMHLPVKKEGVQPVP